MREKILVGAIVAGASAPAQAATYYGVTCDPAVILELQDILSDNGASISGPVPSCLPVEVDLDRSYSELAIPEGRACREDCDGYIVDPYEEGPLCEDGIELFAGPVADPALRGMIAAASLSAPAGGVLRLRLAIGIVYDEDDMPVCSSYPGLE